MPPFYLDSSGLAKRYKREKGSEVVRELFLGADPLFTSYLTFLDIIAIARRLYNNRDLTKTGYEMLMGVVTRDFAHSLRVQPISNEVADMAAEISLEHGLEGSDAIQLATARLTKSSSASTAARPASCILVSSDRRMLSVYRQLNGTVLDPEEAEAMDTLSRLRVG